MGMKFPLKVLVDIHGEMREGVISIASVNAVVKSCIRRKKEPTQISIRVEGSSGVYRSRTAFADIYCAHEEEDLPVGEDIRDEIKRRVRANKSATLDLGTTALKPCVCLRVTLQVKTKNGLPTEHPDATPKFRVQLRYWDGNTHTLWANYNPRNDKLTVKLKRVKTDLVFANHDQVLTAIRELMPK